MILFMDFGGLNHGWRCDRPGALPTRELTRDGDASYLRHIGYALYTPYAVRPHTTLKFRRRRTRNETETETDRTTFNSTLKLTLWTTLERCNGRFCRGSGCAAVEAAADTAMETSQAGRGVAYCHRGEDVQYGAGGAGAGAWPWPWAYASVEGERGVGGIRGAEES